jgi:hypothetical protein
MHIVGFLPIEWRTCDGNFPWLERYRRSFQPNISSGANYNKNPTLQKEAIMGMREEYQALIERQLNEWKTYTERLKSQADQLGAQAKAQFEKQLEVIRAKQNEALENFSRLKAAAADDWAQWKSKLDKAWDEMKVASDRLIDQFRKKK